MPLRPEMQPAEYLEILKRRKWLVVFSFLFVVLGASMYCVVVPEQYKSSTTILIIPQSVPEDYVRSTISVRVEEQLATIKQQVLSRTTLMKVVDEVGLFPKERQRRPVEELVDMMRRRIDIVVVEGKRRDSSEAFTLSFVYEDRRATMLAAARLASFFIDENLKTREQQAVGTSEFLDSQLKDTKVKLEAQEAKVKDYKMKFMGELPQQLEANLRMLTGLQDRLRANGDAIRAAEDRKVFLEAQANFLEAPSQSSGGDNGSLAIARHTESLNGMTTELVARRGRLADLSARYTERYPEVLRLRKEIEDLERRIAEARRAPRDDEAAVAPMPLPRSGSTVDEFRRVRAESRSAGAEIASLKKEREDIRQSIAKVEEKIERSPRREQEMISIVRDYDNLKRSYDGLLQKKLEADVSQNLEKRQKGTQFQILDPANLPEAPFKPDRKKAMGLALMVALAIGFGGAIGLEMIDPTLRGKSDFKHFFQIPILACIPVIQDRQFERSQSLRRAGILGGFVAFGAILSLFLLIYSDKIRSILKF